MTGVEPDDEEEFAPLEDDLPEELEYLGSSNSVHDRTQFQSKFDFELSGDRKHYEVDLYLFLPHTLGVTAETYPREMFYGDLTHHLRVRTPEVARGTIPTLSAADDYFEARLDVSKRKQIQELVIHDIKLFGCLMYTELKKLQSDVAAFLQRSRVSPLWASRLTLRLERIHRELRNYRERYVWKLKEQETVIPDEVRRAFLLTDEYLSYRLESVLIGLHRLLEPYELALEDVMMQLKALLMGEREYRNEHVEAARERHEARAETHYYRLGLLKKYVSDVLFLRTERIKKDHVYRNSIAALGAALAAFFATVANFQIMRVATGQDQEENIWRLVTFIVLAVLAYVFKDRIKDLTKDYFNSKIKTWLPDYDVRMLYRYFDPHGQRVEVFLGSSQEFTRYLTRKSLPPDINYIRDVGHRAELEPERNETVIHYNKRMMVQPPGELREHFAHAQVRRIHDVLRFDISQFLAKLDDPKKRLSYFDGDNIITIDAPKVYHLNLLFRYTVTHFEKEKPVKREVEVERLRVILNKQGIVRIEQVLPRGELGYRENLDGMVT